MAGKVAVVTGANSGLGFEIASRLAAEGTEVILACRSQTKGAEAFEMIRSNSPDANIRLMSLDLASLESVRKFAEQLLSEGAPVDILVNNAGVMAVPQRRVTADGFEMQFGTNHLGHFALTGLLAPALLKRPSRVVTVTSFAHRTGRIDFDDLQAERRYMRWVAYGQSKLANLLFALELQRVAEKGRLPLMSLAAHPGFAATHLQDGTSFAGLRVLARPASQGALPIFHAATSANVAGGAFFGPGIIPGRRDRAIKVLPSGGARNARTARRLWAVSEELTGVSFGALSAN